MHHPQFNQFDRRHASEAEDRAPAAPSESSERDPDQQLPLIPPLEEALMDLSNRSRGGTTPRRRARPSLKMKMQRQRRAHPRRSNPVEPPAPQERTPIAQQGRPTALDETSFVTPVDAPFRRRRAVVAAVRNLPSFPALRSRAAASSLAPRNHAPRTAALSSMPAAVSLAARARAPDDRGGLPLFPTLPSSPGSAPLPSAAGREDPPLL